MPPRNVYVFISTLFTLALISCAGTYESILPTPSTYDPTSSREAQLRSQWVGKTYTELVAQYGKPITTYKSPITGNPRRAIVHYGIQSDLSNCYDAFVVIHGRRYISKPVIADYYCR